MLSATGKSSSKSRIASLAKDSTNGNLHLSDNALQVLQRRYLVKNEKGESVEKPHEMYHRIAGNIAKADAIYDKDASMRLNGITIGAGVAIRLR